MQVIDDAIGAGIRESLLVATRSGLGINSLGGSESEPGRKGPTRVKAIIVSTPGIRMPRDIPRRAELV